MNKFIEYNNMIKKKKENGFYDLDADKEALKYYKCHILTETMHFISWEEKFDYLVKEEYYVDFYKKYKKKEILDLKDLIYNYHFQFQSFMAAQKFYETYALKTRDRTQYLETYEDRIISTSLFLAEGDIEYAKILAEKMIKQEYQPATPTFLNSGKKYSGELVSCFLLEVDDSLNSINYSLSTSMQLSKIGGGVAINLSRLRGRGEEIKGNKGVGRGVLPVMKLFEDAFNYVDQLGQRPGAGAVYLNIFHSDVIEFLDTKKINADEKNRIQTLSIGLVIPNKFMELAKENKDMHLFYPYTVYKEYGILLDDMNLDEMYDELVANKNVKSKIIKARTMLQRIATTQFESGYPYLVYIDNANKVHALKDIGKIKISNLCTEIFQLQTTSNITDYHDKDEIGYDISCNLGSLNIVNVMNNKDIANTIDIAMKALTSVSNKSNIKNAPGIQKANNDFHSVGLGVMNLHGYFTNNKIMYESNEAKDFCNTFFALINYYSLKSSMKIAKDTKKTFVGFERSEYANGNYFDKYLKNEYVPQAEKINTLFEGIYIPTKEDWIQLKEQVQKYGLYHAYRIAIAPTQSISYVQNSTASIQPVVDIVETRMYGNALTYYPMPFLREDNILYYKSAYNMNQEAIIDLVSIVQEHVDQGISTVLYVTNQTTTKDLARLYFYAWSKGLKSLYYIRTKNLTIEECETCSV